MQSKSTKPPVQKKAKVVKLNKYPYLVTGEELLNSPVTKIPCLWEPYFIQQGLISLTGGSDVGKSSFLRQFAIAVVLKDKCFLGKPLNVRFGRALYLATEDNKITAQFTLQNSVDANVKPSHLQELCYLINPDNPLKAVEEQLKVAKTDVVIIDSFGDVFNGNLNDNTNVRTTLNGYQRLSEKYDTLFIFLHHTAKRTENNNPNKNNVIGSQGFEAKMRLVMELRKPDSSKKRVLYFTKGNHLSEAIKSQSMELNFDDKQKFHFTGTGSNTNANVNTRIFTEKNKAEILSIAKSLREQDFSLDKILIELKNRGLEKVPSKGKLHEWLSLDKVVQSA